MLKEKLLKNIDILLLILIIILALFIRFHNLFNYNSWWADDGGAHIQYAQIILEKHRLPQLQETYLAWHEPLFYLILAIWTKIGFLFSFNSLNWQEGFNIIIFTILILIIWFFTKNYTKNRAIAIFTTFASSILFTGVKLSAYINNELLAQTLIILLIFLFIYWRLTEAKKEKKLIIWAIILGFTLLVKLTTIIILGIATIIWLNIIIREKKYFLFFYLFLTIFLIFTINLPWLYYKEKTFGKVATINLYEKEKKNIFTSPAWNYIFTFNKSIFLTHPYWINPPKSFISILIADTFGDYYNLFNNQDKINQLPDNETIIVSNGRKTTLILKEKLLPVNKIGLIIFGLWAIGLFLYLINYKKNHWTKDPNQLFILLAITGGFAALIYNNLRLPYLERGVLKAQFIFFVFPLIILLTSQHWWMVTKKINWIMINLLPFVVYLIVAWPILLV